MNVIAQSAGSFGYRPMFFALLGALILVACVVALLVAIALFADASPKLRQRCFKAMGIAAVTVLLLSVLVGGSRTVTTEQVFLSTHSASVETKSATTPAVDPSKYVATPAAVAHADSAAVYASPTWARLSVMVVTAIGAMMAVLFVVRKVEAFVFWKTSWKPAGAVASAAVLGTVGSLFVWKAPNPAYTPMFSESPSFETFLDRRFGRGSGNSGFSELIEMASDPELLESEARVPDATVIGRLPYGKPTEPNSNYSDSFVFTAGRAGAPDVEGVWAPLICNDEIYRINAADSLNRTLVGAGTEHVSHEESEPIPDDAVVFIGQRESVRLSAIASGQFTTVHEAWDDVLSKLRTRAAEEHPATDSKYYAEMAVRGLHNAVTRLAVSRRPLILESELNGEIVEPMYRVHIAIDDAGWDRTIDPRSFAMDQGRERSMILIVVLSALTLGIGMLGGNRQTVEA